MTFLKSERLTMHVIAPKEPVPIRFDAFGFGDAPCRLLRVNGVHGRPSVYRGTCFDARHKLEDAEDAGWESSKACKNAEKFAATLAVWEHVKDKEGREGSSRRAFWLEVVTMQCYSRYCLQYPFWVKLSALRLRIVAYGSALCSL